MRIRSTVGAVLTAGAVALLTTGCLSPASSANTSNSIELMYGFTGEQDRDFQAAFKEFLSENPDIQIRFSPTPDLDALIKTRAQGNQLPDIALFPQPGTLASIARSGKLADLSGTLDLSDLKATMAPGTLEVGQVDGTQYAVMVNASIKSLVYYPKKAAQAAGITQPPQTFDQLQAMSTRIAASGTTPWCFGIASGSKETGWAAADWVENLMLIDYGTDVYQQWVDHELPFNDPKVLAVTDQIDQLLLADGMTHGGRKSIATDDVQTAGNPMFDATPGCYLYRQGNVAVQPGFFPDAVERDLDADVGVFAMPGTTAQSRPVIGGGDLAALFSGGNAAAQKVLTFMTSAQFQEKLTPTGWYLSPRRDVDLSTYPNETVKSFATLLAGRTEFVFDGSDQMPAKVGSGSFPKEMTAWISGEKTAEQALDTVEASWPE